MLKWFRHEREVEERWTIAQGQEDGKQVLYRFRNAEPRGIHREDFPRLINIYWRFDGTNTGGMPPSLIHQRMVNLEEALDPVEGPSVGFHVLAITGNSRKEWVWYAVSAERFLEAVNQALAGREPFPIEIEEAVDPEWATFRGFLDSAT
jgi:hypothetical protein